MMQVPNPLKSSVGGIIDFLLPPQCLACDRIVGRQGGLCAQCWGRLHFISQPFCNVLGRPFSVNLGDGIISAEAIASPPVFDQLRSVVVYDEVARRLVTALKFGDRSELAPWMADWMSVAGSELIENSDLVMPVPLHRWRLFYRQYNQSAELAGPIAAKHGLAYKPVWVKRARKTRQQVGLNAREREKNVRGAFTISPEYKVELAGKRVLLVDDVYTTGATVNAVSRALKRAGAKSVNVLTFAMVNGHPI